MSGVNIKQIKEYSFENIFFNKNNADRFFDVIKQNSINIFKFKYFNKEQAISNVIFLLNIAYKLIITDEINKDKDSNEEKIQNIIDKLKLECNSEGKIVF